MNYISQIRAFYDALLVRPLSAGQIALWHGLMDRCNRLGWPEWFTAANISLESSCSLSRKGIYDSRNSLKQAGLIDSRSNGTKAASYKIIVLYSTQDTTQATQDSVKTTQATLSEEDKAVLDLIRKNPSMTQKVIAMELDWKVDRVKYYLNKLKKNKVIQRVGSSQKGYWDIL